jgi:multiple sugar transport system ATP-binding protein
VAEVVIRGLSKQYTKGVYAVDSVDLHVADREFMVLVGPSGCGKSTLLRMVAGLEEPDSGEIEIGGRRVNDVAPKDRNIAMVFQDYALYPHMTAFDNIAFSLKLRKTPKAEIRTRVEEVAALLGLAALLERKPKDLSGGERQRVALGRAIIRRPEVFLFDEPLSNLDARLRGEMRVELQKLQRRLNTTMIYVTHDQMEAMTMGHRIAVLSAGRLQQVADPLSLYERPVNRFVAGFVGSPPMNQIPGRLETHQELHFAGGGLSLPLGPRWGRLAGQSGMAVVLGARPEDIHPAGADSPGEAAPASSADAAGGIFRARVEVVEPLGSEVLLVVAAGETSLSVRLRSGRPPRVGENLMLRMDRDRLHLFSADGGEALDAAVPNS